MSMNDRSGFAVLHPRDVNIQKVKNLIIDADRVFKDVEGLFVQVEFVFTNVDDRYVIKSYNTSVTTQGELSTIVRFKKGYLKEAIYVNDQLHTIVACNGHNYAIKNSAKFVINM